MFRLRSIIKGNYLEYIRSYSFLITIAVSLYVAFSFLPAPEANYSTIRFGNYTGVYNASWIGFVTAVMSSVFLSLFGFFLINGSVKKDIDTRIGHIIGSSRISNAVYLLSKLASSFLILFTILIFILIVSVILFFLYGKEHSFQLYDFVIPYLIIVVPSLFFVASFSLLLEVFLTKKVLIQYVLFLSTFFFVLFSSTTKENNFVTDVFGIQYPAKVVEQQIQEMHQKENTKLSIGFISGGRDMDKIVTIESISFSTKYLLARLFWVIIAIVLVYILSFFFHRFNIKEGQNQQQNSLERPLKKTAKFQLRNLAQTVEISAKLSPLIYAEVMMLLRKNTKWILVLTFCGMITMIFVPISISHRYILPLLWFLQISAWSDLASKDETYRTHYFVASSYQPLQRLFIARLVAGILLALFVAGPLLIRYMFSLDIMSLINIIFGALFIVMLAVFFDVLTKSKKFFEILFFFLIYSNMNLVPFADYFGAIHSTTGYTVSMLVLILILFSSSYILKRKSYE